MAIKLLKRLLESRFAALAVKEIHQILRSKQLLILLILSPTLQLLIYGYALNPDVKNLKLGIVDYTNDAASQELVSALTEKRVFIAESDAVSEADLTRKIEEGKIAAGVVIPPNFESNLSGGQPTEIQVWIDGVDANTAGIVKGYITSIISQYGARRSPDRVPALIKFQTTFLYNSDLISSWFFVPGVMGLVLTLIGSLVSSLAVVREKDTGTLEQLLMTPAEGWEILLAKIVPLSVLLMGDVLLALSVSRLVFGVPFRGSFPLFLVLSELYIFVGIGIGIMLATISRSQQQVILTSFFINLPSIQLSGAIAPIESMPLLFQYLSLLNPLRHYIEIVRGLLLKGVGLEVLWPNAIALVAFAAVLLTVSISRFRNQLS